MTWNDIYNLPNHEADLWCVTLAPHIGHVYKQKVRATMVNDTLFVSMRIEYCTNPISFNIGKERHGEYASKIIYVREGGRVVMMISINPNPIAAILQLKSALRRSNPYHFHLRFLEDLKYNLSFFNEDVKTLSRFIKEKNAHTKFLILDMKRRINKLLHNPRILNEHKPRLLASRLLPLMDTLEDHKLNRDWLAFHKKYGTTRTT